MLSRIKFPRTTGMILAGGRVGELSVLTLERPKSALPFAGHFRIIDFPLSNMAHAGITNVGILSQYRPASLIDHVGVGESWDFIGLDRGAKILPPYHAAEAMDWYRGNADAVLQNLVYLRELDTQIALIVSGDHVYSMDYRKLIYEHLERGADLTIAFKSIQEPDRRFGYGVLGPDGALERYEEKPTAPPSDLVSLTVYVFNIDPLEAVLSRMREHDSIEFGRDVIPAMMADYRVCGHVFDGYWAYSRTVDGYYDAHRDLLDGVIDIESWDVRTNNNDNSLVRQTPPIFRAGSVIEDSLISEGCMIAGTVRGSVLGPGVHVAAGATVEASILYQGVDVGAETQIRTAIVDKRVRLGRGVRIGLDAAPPTAPGDVNVSQKGIALVGKDAHLADETVIPQSGLVAPAGQTQRGAQGGR